MPYIKAEEKEMVQVVRAPQTVGQLNYLLTSLCLLYIRTRNALPELGGEALISYGAINDVVGALECAKMEFYRRQAVDYENKKAIDNGDLPWLTS